MRKSHNEITAIMNEIVAVNNKYYYTVKEIAEMFGISRNTATEMCKRIPAATLNNAQKYYIRDILKAVYK